MTGPIDEFFIALGFRPDSSGLKAFQREAEEAKSTMLSIGTALTAFATGFAVKEIAKIGSDFEQTRIQIAGFFTALGQSHDFESALGDADEALQMIASAAAKLPGEAEEYQQVFTDTFSFVKGAVGGSIKEMTDFTNTLTAIGKAGRLDAGQIAREADELLSAGEGRAATRNRLWMQLLPLMRKLQGQSKLTAKEFNAMTETKRADLMKQAMAGLQPMLLASAKTFDAMWGAMVSGGKKLARLGTAGLFDRMKKALSDLNDMFFDADFNLTEFGQSVVDGGKKIVKMIGNVVDFGVAVAKWFGQSEFAAKGLKAGLALLGITLGGLAFEKVAGQVGRLVTGLTGLKRLLTGGLLAAIYLVAEDLWVFYRGGISVTGLLVNKLGPAGLWLAKTVLGGLSVAFLALRFQAVRTALVMAAQWAIAFWPITLGIATLVALGLEIYNISARWNEFSAGTKTAIAVVGAALGVLAAAFLATKAAAIASAIATGIAWLAALGPLALIVLGLAAIGVAAYNLSDDFKDAVDQMTSTWDDFVDGFKETYNTLVKITSLGLASGPFDTNADKTHREYDDFQKGQVYRKAHKGENEAAGMSELPRKPTGSSVDASWMPGAFKNRNARPEDFTKYQSGADEDTTTPDERESFTAEERARYDANRRHFSQAFAEQVKRGMAAPGANPYGIVDAPGASRTPENPVLMTGAQAGIGSSVTNNTSNTNVTSGPVTINVTGVQDTQATAKAVRRELERVQQSTIHHANQKGAAL